MGNEQYHIPVLLNEILDVFGAMGEGVIMDGTLGGGGHSAALLDKIPGLHIIGIDRDADAISFASQRLASYGSRIKIYSARFDEMNKIAASVAPEGVDGILLDLGISSKQIDNSARGFSFSASGPLDMRMDKRNPMSAFELINDGQQSALEKIFREYGEERKAGKIASAIVSRRTVRKIETTAELADIIGSVCGRDVKAKARIFQAIRIAVNCEMDSLDKVLETAPALLKSGGRMAVISYHSLEDRRVKRVFRDLTDYVDRGTARLPGDENPSPPPFKLVTRKAIIPTDSEIALNSRARSAKLRVLEKI
ncbi:MAG: 16S rRNA (cytosine(1402)-N(4))-methyltransferase RsmH [Fibrobacteres bacterium]|nr:16S rRNA (cytosine(1402)-N(4))-methyltransferase RsmH [Fibrobacterota bacterium]